jgi:hypothetical protein
MVKMLWLSFSIDSIYFELAKAEHIISEVNRMGSESMHPLLVEDKE